MALAVSNIKKRQMGGVFIATFDVTPSSSYSTGGEALSPTLETIHPLGRSPDFVRCEANRGFEPRYDYTNKKLQFFTNTAGGSNGELGEHTAASYVAGITAVAHRGTAIWLT